MKQDVVSAIEELKHAFPSSEILSLEDGNGGAYVVIEDVDIGDQYQPSSTWLGGHITALYPYADIYPHFIGDNVSRVDGVPFDAPITAGAQFFGKPALQVSRRNNQTQNFPQTAVSKFVKVLHFIKEFR